MKFFKTPNIDFLGKRLIAYVFSVIFVLASILILVIKGPRYGIDFTGGTLVQIRFEKDVSPGDVRAELAKIGIAKAELQNYGSIKDYLIRYSEDVDPDSLVNDFRKSLKQNIILERTEKVGPRIGKELQIKAIEAILIGMALMLIYIAFRFNFVFGVAAVIAIFHDVIITLGILTLLNKEITIPIIAALLTIVGYSINDSIIVSDRIRENLKKMKGNFTEIANRSINQTLSRTIITSGTTLIVVLCLLFLGGPILQDFSLALAAGIAVGTYSSIYVVASLVNEWQKGRRKR